MMSISCSILKALSVLAGSGFARGRRAAFAVGPGSPGRAEDPGPGAPRSAACDPSAVDSAAVRGGSQVVGSPSSRCAPRLL